MRYLILFSLILLLGTANVDRRKVMNQMQEMRRQARMKRASSMQVSEASPQICGTYQGCFPTDSEDIHILYTYTLIGKTQDIPTRYNLTTSYYIGEAALTCSNDALVLSEKTTGTVKKGPGDNVYLMDIDGVYETLSELGFLLYECENYHTAGVEFDLMTSECPDLQSAKQLYEFGVFYLNNIDFYDTHLVSLGLTFTLINDNGCEADPLPPVDDKDNNSSSTWIIILIVVVVVIVIVVLVLILLLRKKGNHELKVVNGSEAPKNSQPASKPVTITVPGVQPVVPPTMPNPQSPAVPTMPSPAVLPNMPGGQPVVLIPIGAAPQPSRIPLPTNLPTPVIIPNTHPST